MLSRTAFWRWSPASIDILVAGHRTKSMCRKHSPTQWGSDQSCCVDLLLYVPLRWYHSRPFGVEDRGHYFYALHQKKHAHRIEPIPSDDNCRDQREHLQSSHTSSRILKTVLTLVWLSLVIHQQLHQELHDPIDSNARQAHWAWTAHQATNCCLLTSR